MAEEKNDAKKKAKGYMPTKFQLGIVVAVIVVLIIFLAPVVPVTTQSITTEVIHPWGISERGVDVPQYGEKREWVTIYEYLTE